MQSFFWHVLADRRVYSRLNAELDQAVQDGTIPASGNLSWNESQALPYFQACLREAMRVRPAVGLNITRLVPPEGAELDGHSFPAGTRIAVNGWVLHRDRKTFGDDADDFRPERWLEDAERARTMDRYMFQVRDIFSSLTRSYGSVSSADLLYVDDSLAVEAMCASVATSPC
jgi:cytochrome P450